jgi:hypothetical protein
MSGIKSFGSWSLLLCLYRMVGRSLRIASFQSGSKFNIDIDDY